MDRWVARRRILIKNERGFSLIEVLIALAILGLVAVAFLSGLTTASRALIIADERTTAESLAKSQMEYVKNIDYVDEATSYPAASIPQEHIDAGYSATITALPLHNPDDGIQKITVVVKHGDKEVIILEGYKVSR